MRFFISVIGPGNCLQAIRMGVGVISFISLLIEITALSSYGPVFANSYLIYSAQCFIVYNKGREKVSIEDNS